MYVCMYVCDDDVSDDFKINDEDGDDTDYDDDLVSPTLPDKILLSLSITD